MSAVGIDLGSLQSVISVARNHGIDVICNELSNRATPSFVSFGKKQRYLGEAAKLQEITNYKNTVGSLKRLVGRTLSDPDLQEHEKKFITSELVDVNGQVGVKVNYLDESQCFSNIQLLAMYLSKLKDITSNEIDVPVSDCVITVPGWFTEVQRRAIMSAAEIVGLNCLCLMNDLTAAALGYGITKTDLPEKKSRNVVFVDVGHSGYSVSVVSFVKGKLEVRGSAFDEHFGGRNFDDVIVEHLATEFKEKFKIDVYTNGKSLIRLMVAAERCKKVLSANSQASVNIESIMDDSDVQTIVYRTDFEEWADHLFTQMENILRKALENAGMTVEDIDAIEMIGGATRIPAIKTTISNFFGKPISTTLNQDEAVSRGAALQCAILSPVFNVRDFFVRDICSYPIKFEWTKSPEDDDTEIVVFDNSNSIPSTKILTFYRKEPFTLEAKYAKPEVLSPGTNPWLGQYTIKDVKPTASGEPAQIKVKVNLNIHGILSVESALTVEEKREEVMNGKVGTKKFKKFVKTSNLTVVSYTTSVSTELVNKYAEKETQMAATDKLIKATEAAKNSLEEYGYDMRDKITGPLGEYIDVNIKDQFTEDLNTVVDWIYDEGDDQPKSVYVEKLETLMATGNPVMERYREAEERPRAANSLRETINRVTQEAMSTDDKYSHIATQEKQDIVDRCDRAGRWLDEQLVKQDKVPKCETPVFFARDIGKEEEALVNFATPILNKPKSADATTKENSMDSPMEDDSEEMDID